jgi:NADPH-ferrihemoprotein reductase
LFGSQTGTAEELAGRLAKDLHRYGKKPLVMDPEEIDIEDLPKITGKIYAISIVDLSGSVI